MVVLFCGRPSGEVARTPFPSVARQSGQFLLHGFAPRFSTYFHLVRGRVVRCSGTWQSPCRSCDAGVTRLAARRSTDGYFKRRRQSPDGFDVGLTLRHSEGWPFPPSIGAPPAFRTSPERVNAARNLLQLGRSHGAFYVLKVIDVAPD
jgi:hypothetical protein